MVGKWGPGVYPCAHTKGIPSSSSLQTDDRSFVGLYDVFLLNLDRVGVEPLGL